MVHFLIPVTKLHQRFMKIREPFKKKAPDLEVRGSHEKNGKIAFGQ